MANHDRNHNHKPKQDIKALIAEMREVYRGYKPVRCTVLDEDVLFTSDGFIHLLYESNRQPRTIDEQYLKLKCLPCAPRVIARCKVITATRKIRFKVKGKWKNGKRYELIHEAIPGERHKVILQKIGTGNLTFLSIMPFHRETKKRLLRRS